MNHHEELTICTGLLDLLRTPDPKSFSPAPDDQSPALDCHAIRRCVEAYNRARAEQIKLKISKFDVENAAKQAYRCAMPPLIGHRNIAEYVACLAQGLTLKVFTTDEIGKFLYAAQVASSLLPKSPKTISPAPVPQTLDPRP